MQEKLHNGPVAVRTGHVKRRGATTVECRPACPARAGHTEPRVRGEWWFYQPLAKVWCEGGGYAVALAPFSRSSCQSLTDAEGASHDLMPPISLAAVVPAWTRVNA